jgi:hypothetical protein
MMTVRRMNPPPVFGALLLVLVVLGSCSGPPPVPAPAPTTRSTVAASAESRTAQPSPASPDLTTWVIEENAREGDGDWRIPNVRVAADDELSGYASAASARAGDRVDLMVSSTLGDVVVIAYRLGHYGGAGAREVWRSVPVPGVRQPEPSVDDERMVVADWEPSLTVDTSGWLPGSYLFRLTANSRSTYVPLTVVSTDVTDRLVIVSAVTTYAAYNTWGGYSLYYDAATRDFGRRSLRVSFDRPYDGIGAKTLLQYEQGLIQVAEEAGLPVAYLTNLELHADPDALAGAAGVVSTGHDEYWSKEMRSGVEQARDAGTNVGFFGANAMYWRIRFEEGGRVIAGYKDASLDPVPDDSTTTVRWRQAPHPDPESSLVGMLYECFPAAGPFVVHDPGFWGFADADVQVGDSFAGLVGTEIDRAYPGFDTPENLQVVAHSPVQCASIGATHSDMTYYTTDSGAGVVATGTMLWTIALRGENERNGIGSRTVEFARTVTRTVLTEMAAGPLGDRHPSQGNLDEIDPPASTRTGTGGPVAGVG